jgi:hypothetical protein
MPRLTFGRHAAGALPPSTDLVRLGRCRRILRGVTPYSLFSAHERTAQGLGQVGALRKPPNKHALRTLVLASGVWTTPMTAKRRNESGKTPGPLHHVDSTRLSKSATNSTRRLGLGQPPVCYQSCHTATMRSAHEDILCRSRPDSFFRDGSGVESGRMWGPQRD